MILGFEVRSLGFRVRRSGIYSELQLSSIRFEGFAS